MAEHVVELGLSKPLPSNDRQLEILRWLIGRLVDLALTTLGEVDPAERAGVEDAVARYRARIMDPDQIDGLEADAHGCASLCEREMGRARGATRERESGLREIIAVLMAAVDQLLGDSKSFNADLLGRSDKISRVVETNDIRDLKRQVSEHVDSLRRTVVEKQKRDEASQSKLTRRVELLQARLTEVEQEAASDPLTGVANRRAFDRTLLQLAATAAESGRPLTMAMLDTDHMKALNDTHGHQIGDRVLIGMVQQVQALVRKTDFLARYGGDEFALVMPDMTVSEAEARLTEVVRQIAATRFEYDKGSDRSTVQFTISCGLTPFATGDSPDDLLRRADDALYEAKRAGGNRVTVRTRSKIGAWLGRLAGTSSSPKDRSAA